MSSLIGFQIPFQSISKDNHHGFKLVCSAKRTAISVLSYRVPVFIQSFNIGLHIGLSIIVIKIT